MDLDNMRVNRMHPAERERRATEGLCFNCGQHGHLAVSCNNATKTGRTGFSRGRGNRGNQGSQRGGGNIGFSNYASRVYGQTQGSFNNYSQQTPTAFTGYMGNQTGTPGFYGGRQGPVRGFSTRGSGDYGRQKLRFMDIERPGYVVGEVTADGTSDYYDQNHHEFEYPVEDDTRNGQQGNA
jgi:hypothetical protein